MIAMNRGFLYAGASNVIFTLFKVYDNDSSELTPAFFKRVLDGNSYSKALAEAKKSMIQKGDVTPKSWAGFVMIGND